MNAEQIMIGTESVMGFKLPYPTPRAESAEVSEFNAMVMEAAHPRLPTALSELDTVRRYALEGGDVMPYISDAEQLYQVREYLRGEATHQPISQAANLSHARLIVEIARAHKIPPQIFDDYLHTQIAAHGANEISEHDYWFLNGTMKSDPQYDSLSKIKNKLTEIGNKNLKPEETAYKDAVGICTTAILNYEDALEKGNITPGEFIKMLHDA